MIYVPDLKKYTGSLLLGIAMTAIISAGIALLSNTRQAPRQAHIDVSIRLVQPLPEQTPKQEQRTLEKQQPPEKLPRTFSVQQKTAPQKPVMQLKTPSFSAELHPSLSGGIALPSGPGGDIGFNLDEVDVVPKVTRAITPHYPFGAKRNHTEGEVVLRLLVTRKGDPVKISVHSAKPPGIFEKAAINAATRWRFQAGQYAGKAVDTWVLLPFKFELKR